MRLPKISKPAIQALEKVGIKTLEDCTQFTEQELLGLHGFGQKGLDILKTALETAGLSLKEGKSCTD
jgi:DNA-directed RNA polymerase alpha subunit